MKKGNKYGVINIKGDSIIKPKYDIIQSDGYYEEGSAYNKSGFIVGESTDNGYKYGYINFRGKQLLDNKYNQIERIINIDKNEDSYIVAFQNDIAGFYKNDQNIINHEYEDIIYDTNNNCLILQKNSKQGVSELTGKILIEIKYDNIFTSGKYVNCVKEGVVEVYDYSINQKLNLDNIISVNETLNNNYSIIINQNEKYQILDVKTNEIKQKQYDYLEYLYDDYFIASINQKYGIIDNSENKIIDFKYNFIQRLSDSKIVQGVIEKNNITDLIVQDNIILSMKNAEVYLYNDYINIQSGTESKFIDFDGKILENKQIFEKQVYAIKENGKWGFLNKNNEIIIKPEYDFVTEFNEYGFAGIKKDGKWGCVSINGEVVIEPTYEISFNNPNFIGKYYKIYLGYGQPYYVCENTL